MSNRTPGFEDLRRYKVMFDNTWTLSTVLASATVVVSWYFGLVQLDLGPVIWTLAGLALIQFVLQQSSRMGTSERVRLLAFSSQLLGTALMGIGWHLFGGLKQPLFPLFIVLPLLPGSLVLRFWQQQLSILAFVGLLATGVLLSPDSNSFIDERYGITINSAHVLPVWIPRSRTVFSDVTTSPAYDLLLVATVVLIAIAVSSTAGALASVCARAADRVRKIEGELARLQELTTQIVTHAPSAEVLVLSKSGRIVNASDRFLRAFDLQQPAAGCFLLDAIEFAYPSVIKRLMAEGGEEIQGARLRGSNVVLRVRAEVMGSGEFAALNMEPCDEICWRGEVDALDEPVFAINADGDVVYLNRPALAVFGERAEGVAATELFESGVLRWWDIAPLDSARRTLDRGKHRYLVSIRRTRIAESIGELSFIHLHELEPVDAVAMS